MIFTSPPVQGSAPCPPVTLGAQLWPSSLALARHVARQPPSGRCLELGAGLGLVGLVAAACGAQVLVTDLDEMQELLRRHLRERGGGR